MRPQITSMSAAVLVAAAAVPVGVARFSAVRRSSCTNDWNGSVDGAASDAVAVVPPFISWPIIRCNVGQSTTDAPKKLPFTLLSLQFSIMKSMNRISSHQVAAIVHQIIMLFDNLSEDTDYNDDEYLIKYQL